MMFKKGIYPVYKPKGITSYDIIRKIKKEISQNNEKIGHAGTLDPEACGVLIIGIGREFTKKLNQITNQEKEYIAEIVLGEYSSTDDVEGQKIKIKFKKKPTKQEIKEIIKEFKGEIYQKPPFFSAIKISGKPAYFYARLGKKIELKSRLIKIKDILILKYKWPILKIKVICGKGTYIRSLARDIGQKLGTGGYLKSLIRTRIGDFTINKAIRL